jgi:hypothetical protein
MLKVEILDPVQTLAGTERQSIEAENGLYIIMPNGDKYHIECEHGDLTVRKVSGGTIRIEGVCSNKIKIVM